MLLKPLKNTVNLTGRNIYSFVLDFFFQTVSQKLYSQRTR